LRTGTKNKTAVDLARDLLNKFGNLRRILDADLNAFCEFNGLGTSKHTQLQAALELGRRYLQQNLMRKPVVFNAHIARDYLTARLRHYQHEVFACLFLDNRLRLLTFEEISHGTINRADVYPRIVIIRALKCNAAAVIFAHNHPSGVAEPSAIDQEMTNALVDALNLVDIRVIDHYVIGEGAVSSFAEKGLL